MLCGCTKQVQVDLLGAGLRPVAGGALVNWYVARVEGALDAGAGWTEAEAISDALKQARDFGAA